MTWRTMLSLPDAWKVTIQDYTESGGFLSVAAAIRHMIRLFLIELKLEEDEKMGGEYE